MSTDREANAKGELLAQLLFHAEVSETGWAVCKLPSCVVLGHQGDRSLGCGFAGRHDGSVDHN